MGASIHLIMPFRFHQGLVDLHGVSCSSRGFILLLFFYDLIGMSQTLMCLIWLSHYLHRTLIWPLRAELHGRKMPLKIALLAFVFNTINIIIQCLWIFFLEIILRNGSLLAFLCLVVLFLHWNVRQYIFR